MLKIRPVKSNDLPLLKGFAPPDWNTDLSAVFPPTSIFRTFTLSSLRWTSMLSVVRKKFGGHLRHLAAGLGIADNLLRFETIRLFP